MSSTRYEPATPPTTLFDGAFLVTQAGEGAADPRYRAAKAELAARFPAARPREIGQALAAARALLDAAYAVGDRCRAELVTFAEAAAELAARFPGFSAEVYGFVVSYGMFISR